MKINITKKEYQLFLDMVYLSDWVLHAHSEERTEEKKPYKELEQKILAFANEFGMEEMVERNEKSGEHFLNKRFTTNSQIVKHIENFENATFWEELIERLARRDFIKKYGEEAILQMSISERFEKEMSFHQEYHKEFGENGLDNLRIHNL
jgi:cell division protein FtsB